MVSSRREANNSQSLTATYSMDIYFEGFKETKHWSGPPHYSNLREDLRASFARQGVESALSLP
jgi:hypothetical protein